VTRMTWRASLAVLTLVLACGSGARAAEGPAEQARGLLEAAGVRGGLVVHLGCGDGRMTAALRASNAYVVQGLARDEAAAAKARAAIREKGVYGPLSVIAFDGKRLPYTDNLVTLLVADDLGAVPMAEVMRVLAPGGVAMIGGKKTVKPRPDAIDDWTHYLHGPDNNAVAEDTVVAQPLHVQWVGDPKWARHHNHLSSTSAAVSCGGRLFAIVDEGPIATLTPPAEWRLVARDAFNGVVLWKRPIGPWEGYMRGFRSGPVELQRRLVAAPDRVYVTLGYGKPVTALEAASGDVVRTYDETEGALEILHDAGVLYVLAGTIDPRAYAEARKRSRPSPSPHRKRILAIRADSGKVLWTRDDAGTHEALPDTLCAADGKVYLQNLDHVVCLNAATGKQQWAFRRPALRNRLSWAAPTLVVRDGVVLSADMSAKGKGAKTTGDQATWKVTSSPMTSDADLVALDAATGKELWRCPAAQGYCAPPDVFVMGDTVWVAQAPGRNTVDFTEGRDLRTGKVTKRLNTEAAFTETQHHRCFRDKATSRYIILGRTGVEWIDLDGGEPLRHCWVRGACQYGVLPANGLLYTPPHACACYIQSKLSGWRALAPKRAMPSPDPDGDRLMRGKAFGEIENRKSQSANGDDWPTYRHDPGRTGRTEAAVPANLASAWQRDLGGRLTSPVVAGDVLLVATVDRHTVHALDAGTGQPLWRYTAGGRIDSPPTVHAGLALFGCADGTVTALRMADGARVWRFQAAPTDRRTVCRGQVESVWPVTGSVLVRDGVVYATAGRSSYLDGGMLLYRLDPATGKMLGRTRFYNRDPETGAEPEAVINDVELPGALPDVLVSDGPHIYLRDKRLDPDGTEHQQTVPHLYASDGLLAGKWFHLTYWTWAARNWCRASGWHIADAYRPSGRILVCDEATVVGYGRKQVTGGSKDLRGYHLFRADKKLEPMTKRPKQVERNNNKALASLFQPAKVTYHWSRQVPLVVRGLVFAGDTIFAAGPVMDADDKEPGFTPDAPAVLTAWAAKDGAERARCPLPATPVFDGLIAAHKRIYASTVDGKVVCLAGRE